MRDVSPGPLPLMRTSRGEVATALATASLATEMRWMGTGLSTTTDLPDLTNSSRAPEPDGPAFWGAGFCADATRPTNIIATVARARGRIIIVLPPVRVGTWFQSFWCRE